MNFKDWPDEDLVEELCDIEEGLTGWETEFVESIAARVLGDRRKLTEDQRAKAIEILDGREG